MRRRPSLAYAQPMLAGSASQPREEIEQLIEGCLQGEQQACSLVVWRYRRQVFHVAYKFVGRHDLAEDLTQEIFLKVFKVLGTFDWRNNFQTWLISVSRNLYINARKEHETLHGGIDVDAVSLVGTEPAIATQLVRRADGGALYGWTREQVSICASGLRRGAEPCGIQLDPYGMSRARPCH